MTRPLFVSFRGVHETGAEMFGNCLVDIGPIHDDGTLQALHRDIRSKYEFVHGKLVILSFQRLEAPAP